MIGNDRWVSSLRILCSALQNEIDCYNNFLLKELRKKLLINYFGIEQRFQGL